MFPTDLCDLEDEFSDAEVKTALFEINGDKAPGPDGFTGRFFQSCWNTVKPEMLAAIHAFTHLQTGEFDALNEATLILIPKKADAQEPKNNRPISLICFFAKLISKMLAKRLQPKMETLVNPAQSVFIKGRVIHDNFNYVQGLARSYYVRKTPALLLKLDIEKAFDAVSWDFLLEVLEAKGFEQKWRNWISAILATASTRVLVIGELSDKIWYRCGLRQGDPLSPMLFVLVMDVLPALLHVADREGVSGQSDRS
jgi:hypothetical protein